MPCNYSNTYNFHKHQLRRGVTAAVKSDFKSSAALDTISQLGLLHYRGGRGGSKVIKNIGVVISVSSRFSQRGQQYSTPSQQSQAKPLLILGTHPQSSLDVTGAHDSSTYGNRPVIQAYG